ncbi:uncharacterized protein LOC123550347 [Mercenaria mercenaria]|uniref:uncharacterized protein LOC123550347 n=1 Tax=Mercenaria mercenaria TaxID=6596 RepID=UPI00234EBC42|nr:uncharacterized protein LOC123550347 [Mercenaria mercenaria]
MRILIHVLVSLVIWTYALAHRELRTDLKCKPYRAYIIWDMYREEGSFYDQRTTISQLINASLEGSVIRLSVVGATLNRTYNFIKDDLNSSWTELIVQIKPGNISHKIPYTVLKTEVSDTLTHSNSLRMSEEFFLVLDGRSKLEKPKKTMKAMKGKKTYVVFAENRELPDAWTRIATDEKHVLEDIGKTDLEEFLNSVCKDSRLYCDTNKYWRDNSTCYRCSFICSQIPSEYCQLACPYFELKTGCAGNSYMATELNDHIKRLSYIEISFSIIMTSLLILIVCIICLDLKIKHLRKLNREKNDIDDAANETLLDKDVQEDIPLKTLKKTNKAKTQEKTPK